MASIKKLSERKFKITVSNGYRAGGKKISRAKTIKVPDTVRRSGIAQYVAHFAEEWERSAKSGYREDADMSFENYAESWLGRQTKYAPSTLASYRRMLKQVYPLIGAIPLKALRPLALENMLIELRKRTSRGRQIREATAQKYLTVVSAVLSDAKKNEIIQKNPARMIDLPDTEASVQLIPTPDEANRIIEVMLDEPWHYLIFYVLAIYTGCRRGELAALKWSDIIINGDEGTLIVSSSRSMVPDVGIVEGKTKNGRSRVVALDDSMVCILKSYYYKKQEEARRGRFKMSCYLFTNERGQLIHPDTFTKRLRRIYDENGFPKEYHLHTLRHYFVSTLLHGGVDKQTVADLAGHGDTAFLERTYCHPQMELKRNAAKVMHAQMFRFG